MHTSASTYTEWTELRRLRLNAGHTISSLAAVVPMSKAQLSHVELGKRGLSDRKLIQLAQALGVEPAELDRSRPKVPPIRRRNVDSTRRRHHHPVDGDGGERKAIA